MIAPNPSTASGFQLPDLYSYCPFPSIYHKNGDAIAAASDKWVEDGCRVFTEDMRRRLYDLKGGQLAAFCFNQCSDERLKVIGDFVILTFLLDNLSDELIANDTKILANVVLTAMKFPEVYQLTQTRGKERHEVEPEPSRLTRDFWTRCIAGAGLEVQARCIENTRLWLSAINQQAHQRATGETPTIEAYVELRRLSSGCRLFFDLIEYSFDIQLPDYIVEDPLMKTLNDCANDFVSFSNDIFSFNVEQSRGDTHNLVAVIMHNEQLDLQGAVDRAGDMCRAAVDKYIETKAKFPSYGPKINKQISAFMYGLESWMIGNLDWSFVTLRYFGTKGQEVKRTRWVTLTRNRVSPGDRV